MVLTQRDIQKNKIDMRYRAEMQKANIFLTLGTVTLIGFIAGMLISKNYLVGSVSSFIIFIISMILYKKSKNRMNEILNELDGL